MWHGKLTWRLLFGHLAVMILPLLIATWYTSSLYRSAFIRQIETGEKRNAYLVARNVVVLLKNKDTVQVNLLCHELSHELDMRITVILPSGKVIGDSHNDPASMENHSYRPEIMEANNGTIGISERYSTTLHKRMKYLAIPAQNDGAIVAVVRTAIPAVSIANALNAYYGKIVLAFLIMVVVAVLLSVLLGRGITRPIKELERGAERFSRGELSTKVTVPGIDELKHLSIALNDMAMQLDNRIRTITSQRNEQEAILSSMSEGVIAVDASERILAINAAAADLFTIEGQAVHSRYFGEVIRNSTAQRFIRRILENQTALEEDITLQASDGERRRELILQIHGTLLRDSGNTVTGAVIVASNVTRLRQFETMRKEFVANVSHELRTPLTAIKGFVETLQQGALDSKEEATRFLNIIAAQVDRLGVLVDDLLTLARIEREEETGSINLADSLLMPVVRSALRDYSAQAASKNIFVNLTGDGSIRAPLDPAMLEQAVGNLIDNAIKYSETGSSVAVSVGSEGNDALISVSDQGIGIPAEHLDRIFERFYRVDKARSRKAGGTGLGLSIVKHIAVLHNGRVTVRSVPGKGSTFTILLPLQKVSTNASKNSLSA
jgi:two-component system phosphate regulon sensor histidine kinase PhoR